MSFDVEEFLARKRPNTAECPIAMDPDAVEAYARAKAAVDVARAVVDESPTSTARAALAEAQEDLEAAEVAARAATQVFTFRGLSEPEWSALIGEHGPTKDQITQARKDQKIPPPWNDDTFPQALIAACSVDPELSAEDVERMRKSEKLNGAEMQALFVAAHDASRTRRVAQLGKGSGSTQS